MNKSQMAKLAAAAGVNGLMYDPNAEGVFGNVQGYTVTIAFGLAHGHGAEPRGFQTARENE